MSSVLKLSDVSVEKILIGKKFKKLSDDDKIIPCKFTRSAMYVQTPPIRLLSGVSDGHITLADQADLFDLVLKTDEYVTSKLQTKWPEIFAGIQSVYKSPISVSSDRQLTMRASVASSANVYSSGKDCTQQDLSSGMAVILLLRIDGILLHKGVITTSWEVAQVKLYSPPKKRVVKLQELSIVEESENECVYDSTVEMLPYYDETGPTEEQAEQAEQEAEPEQETHVHEAEGGSFIISDDSQELDDYPVAEDNLVSEDESPDTHITLV